MGNKKQGQIIIDQPGMTNVVTKEYLQIWGTDVMIHRRFFAYFTIALWFLFQVVWGLVLGVDAVASFYGTLIMMYVNFNVTYWVIIPIQVMFLIAVIGVLYLRHRKYMTVKELNRLEQLRRQQGVNFQDE